MTKFLFFCLVLFSLSFGAQQKFLEVPRLADRDVASLKSEKFPEAPAEILYRSSHFRLNYDGQMTNTVTQRVKIYRKNDAADFLSHEIPVYDNGKGDREMLSGLKAYTYNIENGKVVVTKVERDEKFQSRENKKYSITKFAFSNVKDGSVVEFTYAIITPFVSSTPRVLMEEEIPIRYGEFVLDTPKPIGYSINYKGEVAPTTREVGPRHIYGGEYETFRFGYDNVPAFVSEKFVRNNNNYKTSIKAELNSTFINNNFKSYALTWEDIRKRLYANDNFGSQLRRQNAVKNVLPADIRAIENPEKRAVAVLDFVQKNYTWNKKFDVVAENEVRETLNTKMGGAAELNFLLILLLRSANISANPVVMSTVKNGVLLSYNPSLSQLNYVVAGVDIGKEIYLLDATQKMAGLNLISPNALNQYALLMTEKEVKQLNVFYPYQSETLLTVNASMAPDGSFTGSFTDRDTKLYGMMVHDTYLEDPEKYLHSYKDRYKFALSNIKQGRVGDDGFETSFDFSADTFADGVGKKIVFNPLLFLHSENHDFDQKTKRRADLEFVSGYDRHKKVVITLPPGYGFENVPKTKKFRTEDDGLSYEYVVTQEGQTLTVKTAVKVDGSLFPADYYPAFAQIFDNIVKLESQVVSAVRK